MKIGLLFLLFFAGISLKLTGYILGLGFLDKFISLWLGELPFCAFLNFENAGEFWTFMNVIVMGSFTLILALITRNSYRKTPAVHYWVIKKGRKKDGEIKEPKVMFWNNSNANITIIDYQLILNEPINSTAKIYDPIEKKIDIRLPITIEPGKGITLFFPFNSEDPAELKKIDDYLRNNPKSNENPKLEELFKKIDYLMRIEEYEESNLQKCKQAEIQTRLIQNTIARNQAYDLIQKELYQFTLSNTQLDIRFSNINFPETYTIDLQNHAIWEIKNGKNKKLAQRETVTNESQ